MNKLVKTIIWILLILALLIIAAYFLPSQVFISRELPVNAPSRTVFSQINDLHNWEKWSKWNQLDPNMEIDFVNNGVGLGAGYSWKSTHKKVGVGILQIIESEKYNTVVTEIDFMRKKPAISRFFLKEKNDTTWVKWDLKYNIGYNPLLRWKGLFMERFIGSDLEEGLDNLNLVCKVIEDEKTYQVELKKISETTYAGIREKVLLSEISLKMAEMYGEIMAALQTQKIEMPGKPFSIYHVMSNEYIDLECGIPIPVKLDSTGRVFPGVLKTTECATVDYYGDYGNLEAGHTAVQNWIDKRRFKLAGPPIEIYITDPGTESDQSNWLTEIYYPLRR